MRTNPTSNKTGRRDSYFDYYFKSHLKKVKGSRLEKVKGIRTSLCPALDMPEDITDFEITEYLTRTMAAPEDLTHEQKWDFINTVTPASVAKLFNYYYGSDPDNVADLYNIFYGRREADPILRSAGGEIVKQFMQEKERQSTKAAKMDPFDFEENYRRVYERRLQSNPPPKIVFGLTWKMAIQKFMQTAPVSSLDSSYVQEWCMDYLKTCFLSEPPSAFDLLYGSIVGRYQICKSMSPEEFKDYLLDKCPLRPRLGNYEKLAHGFGFMADPVALYAELKSATSGLFDAEYLRKLTPKLEDQLTKADASGSPMHLGSDVAGHPGTFIPDLPYYHAMMSLLRAATPEPIYQAMLALSPTHQLRTFDDFHEYLHEVVSQKWCHGENLWKAFGIPPATSHNLTGLSLRTFDPHITISPDEPYVRNTLAMINPEFVPSSSTVPRKRQYRPKKKHLKRTFDDSTSAPTQRNKRNRPNN